MSLLLFEMGALQKCCPNKAVIPTLTDKLYIYIAHYGTIKSL